MGWIKLDRKILDNSIWEDKPFNRGAAWVDLLLLANHETTKKIYKGKYMTFKKGDVNRSIEWLADRWGWSRKKVTRFLSVLEEGGMLSRKSTSEGTTLTIVNWGVYQKSGTAEDTSEEHQKNNERTSEEHIQEGYKNIKKEEEDIGSTEPEEENDDWDDIVWRQA